MAHATGPPSLESITKRIVISHTSITSSTASRRTNYEVYRFEHQFCRRAMRPKRRRKRKRHTSHPTSVPLVRGNSNPISPRKPLTGYAAEKWDRETIRSIYSKAISTFSTRDVSMKYHLCKAHRARIVLAVFIGYFSRR